MVVLQKGAIINESLVVSWRCQLRGLFHRLAMVFCCVQRVAQQFGQLGFEFADHLLNSLSLQLFKKEAELVREYCFEIRFELFQRLLHVCFGQ